MKFQGKGDGVIVDGTGASLNVMKKNVKEFTDKGYDVQMLFVETSLETAIARNKARKERSLITKIVETTWDSVQGNKEAYKKLFGERFAEVNTDNLKMGDAMPTILNAANEVAVRCFLEERIGFLDIMRVTEEVLNQIPNIVLNNVDDITLCDLTTRKKAEEIVFALV